MINYELPTYVTIDGVNYNIRGNGDYRAILDIISVYEDEELTAQEKQVCALMLFYNGKVPRDIHAASIKLAEFIDCGQHLRESSKQRPLMNWNHDIQMIIPAINAVAQTEVRNCEYMHWWTFIGYYKQIDAKNPFSLVISIRDKKQKGKKLEKWERDFYNENRDLINIVSEKQSEWLDGDD